MVFCKGSRGCGAEEWAKFGPLSFPSLYKLLPLPHSPFRHSFSYSLYVFLRLTPVNQPSGIIAYITMSWTCDGLKPQRRERWDDCEWVNMVCCEQGEEQNCSGPIAWAFLKTSRDAPINTVWIDGGRRGTTRLSLYFSTYLPTNRHIQDRTIDITEPGECPPSPPHSRPLAKFGPSRLFHQRQPIPQTATSTLSWHYQTPPHHTSLQSQARLHR